MGSRFDLQVFGAGSLGSLIGAFLSSAGLEVRLVGREPHVTEVRRNGVRVEGLDSFTAYPDASTSPSEARVTLVTVKSYDTDEAVSIRGLQDAVVSLQNGMGNEERLRRICEDSRVLAGTTTYGARMDSPGVVEFTGEGTVEVGDADGGSSETADRIAELLSSGLEVESCEEMPRCLWSKTAVNAGINPVTAVSGLTNGEVLDDRRLRRAIEDAADEVEEVASAEGVGIDGSAERAIEVARATSTNTSSMLCDLKEGHETEIDAINGYVVERAREHGIEVPVNRTLTALVKSLSQDQGQETDSDSSPSANDSNVSDSGT